MAQYEVKFADDRFADTMVEADGFEVYPDAQPLVVLFHNNVPRDVDTNANAGPWLGVGNTVRRQIAALSHVFSVREVQV